MIDFICTASLALLKSFRLQLQLLFQLVNFLWNIVVHIIFHFSHEDMLIVSRNLELCFSLGWHGIHISYLFDVVEATDIKLFAYNFFCSTYFLSFCFDVRRTYRDVIILSVE